MNDLHDIKKPESIYVSSLRFLIRSRLGQVGLLLTGFFVFVALVAPLIAPYDPTQSFSGEELSPPSSRYLFGTDEVGRDVLSRIIYGTRITFKVGSVAVILGMIVGVASGMVAGYFGGWVDSLTMRILDLLLAFPPILVGVAVVVALGPGATQAAIALAVINFPQFSRLARAGVLQEKKKDYTVAAQALGCTPGRIIAAHIFPNILAPLFVQFTLALVWAVLLESTLSFLGLGTQPPDPSWGSMLYNSRRHLRVAPWYGLYPGIAVSLLLLGLNSLADAMRDALDPARIRQA
jgi:peptide/nickel transport system permease protein